MAATHPSPHRSILLRSQIIVALLLVSLLLLSSLGIAYYQIHHISSHFANMLDNETQRSQVAFNMSQDALNCRRYEKDLLLNLSEQEAVSDYTDLWHQSYADLIQSMDQLTALAADEDEKTELDDLKAQAEHYNQGMTQLIHQIEAGNIGDPIAGNQELELYKDDIRNLIDASTDLADRETSEAEEVGTNIRSDLKDLLVILLVMTGGSVLLVAVLGIMLPSRLIVPVRRLQQAAEQLTAGDLTIRASVLHNDEIGQLAQSFNIMAETISHQIAEIDQSELVRQQNEQLQQLLELVQVLEIPMIALSSRVLLVPIVGHVSDQRATQISQKVLKAIHEHGASDVLVDITGLVNFDVPARQMIEHMAGASRLLGARMIITGVSAEAAQVIVAHGIQLPDVQTFAQLQDGIAAIMHEQPMLLPIS
ncbi:MAG: HAMP domain-containing protein [Oscillochloris sp.]|nr:HAMP domain-containing protein [Oscillochloris sp.]